MGTELLGNLALGLATAVTLQNLLYCFLGVLLGTLIGVLPGIGPVATIAMLLPITYALEPDLRPHHAGRHLLRRPVRRLDDRNPGQSARRGLLDRNLHRRLPDGAAGAGRPGAGDRGHRLVRRRHDRDDHLCPAGGTAGGHCDAIGPAEYFALMVLGLVGAVVIAHGSVLKAMAMVIVGLILGLVGLDVNSGELRFTFGVTELYDGIGFIALAVGVFAIAEIVTNLQQGEKREVFTDRVGSLMPSREDLKQSAMPIARGTLVGSLLGILPAGGAVLASFAAYAVEKRLATDPSRFGKGAIEGVAAPEAANNAGAQTCFIPMLTLGIPPNVVMALMIGAMMLHNIQPGPQVMTKNPELFWGLIASMWLGNLMLVVLNLPLVGIWVRLLSIPYRLLYPAIILFCCIGVYTLSNSIFDVRLIVLFGALGYLLAKIGCEPAPMLLGFILGPMMEEFFRRALLISRGDFIVFVESPISAGLLAIAMALLVSMSLPVIAKWRGKVIAAQDV